MVIPARSNYIYVYGNGKWSQYKKLFTRYNEKVQINLLIQNLGKFCYGFIKSFICGPASMGGKYDHQQ